MAKTPIDPEMVKRTNVPATPEQLAATAESRRSAALQAVQQQEAQRASRAQAANWVAEAKANSQAALQRLQRDQPKQPSVTPLPRDWKPEPRQPSVPPLPQDWKPEPRPLSIPQQPGGASAVPSSPSRPQGPSRAEKLRQNVQDAEVTFREGKFLGMSPPEWVTNRPDQMDPNRSAVAQMTEYLGRQPGIGQPQQMQPQMPAQPGSVPQGSPSPNRPPAPMGLGDMSQQGQQMPMGLGEGGRALPFNFDPQAMEQSYQTTQPAMGPRGAEYDAARESLRKAAANVAADPRFSQEQRSAAFERIRSKMGELEANFAEGQDLMQSPTGFDAPPPEEFGLLQPGGLQPVGGGQLRNPDTGDILETVRGPNGEVLPVNLRQPEIDALPPGTRYLDQAGKVQVAGEAGGRRAAGGAAAGGAARGGAQPTTPGAFATQEEAFAAYEKWAAKKDPGTTRGEQQIISQVLASIPDEELRNDLQGQIAGDPTRAAEILQQHTQIPLAEEFESARLKEFSAEQKARGERAQRLGREMGLTPPEEKPPAVDPNRYFVETGTRGTTVIKRRGSNVAIPGIFDENGELRAAPQTAQQLMEIEPNTEFVNVRPSSGGKEFRILPFADERVNVGDFALSNEQRRKFANETAQIAPRRPEEWQAFEKALSQFAAVNEPWDPDSNPAQAQLERSVHSFYRELGPAGKAAMTMHVAHALGHVIDRDPKTGSAFKSTGWAAKKIPPQNPAPKDDKNRTALNQMIPAMARLMEDEGVMTRFRRGITGATGEETNASKRDRQAVEIVKTLASSLEEQFPGIERGSPEFKKRAGEAIAALIESNRDSLPDSTSAEALKVMQQRLMEGFGIKPEAAPPPPAAFRPKNRDEMVKGFADAWRKGRIL